MKSCVPQHSSRCVPVILAILVSFIPALSATICVPESHAQTPCPERRAGSPLASADTVKTFYLKNAMQQNDANEIMVALRNMMDPRFRVYLVNSQNALVIDAPPDQLELAQRLITELDRPRKSFRLTYTLTELDGGKRVGERKVAMTITAGQRTSLKQGNKVPVMTGSYDSGTAIEKMQVTYLDVGTNFDATLEEVGNGLSLKSKVEESSLSDDKSGIGAQDPIVRQSVLEGVSPLVPGKPLLLGSLDIPGSTRHFNIEVVADPLP